MAFGFATRTRALIRDGADTPPRVWRYVLDFAAAYADEVSVATLAEMRERAVRRDDGTMGDVLCTSSIADRSLASAIGAAFVPCFPDPALYLPAHAGAPSPTEASSRSPTRVCLFGPESTGKSTLATRLATRYETLHVTEYVRGFLDATGSAGTADDVPWIARGQRAAEIATARQVDRLLICDTNLATVMLWSDILFGSAPSWLRDEVMQQRFELWLLTDIDVPFEPDPQRCFPHDDDRRRLMRECRALLARLGIEPVLLTGGIDARVAAASAAIDRVLGERGAR